MRVGVDIGGTSVKVGLVDESAKILRKQSFPFPRGDAEALACSLRETVEELLKDEGLSMAEITFLGAVVPGSVTPDGSTVIHAYNLEYHDVPLRDILQKRFPGIGIALVNDADGATLAELHYGALKGCKTAALLTLGTGLGGGIVLDGRLFHGGEGNGIELGHMILVDGGRPCTCGNRGCAEVYCSATALIGLGKDAAAAHPDSLLAAGCAGNPENIDAKLVIDCAREGDCAALAAFREYVGHLSSACASIFNAFDPEKLAIGGGVCGAGAFLFDPLWEQTKQKCFFARERAVVPAELGNDAGIIGAALCIG